MKVLFLVFLFLFSITYAQTTKQRIAVLELEADGVSKKESITLTNRLRSELVKTGSFTIIERGEMDEILKEQGFQLSGCTSDECVVEAGRLLNVKQIAAGSIGKVGALYTVAVRLIDVQTGEISKTVTEDCQCPIERVLTNSMRNAALKLAGRMSSGIGIAVLSEGSGDIFIKTNPGGADVYLDNIQTGKTSPVTLQDVAAGKHFIKVVKGKYIGTKSVTVKANDIVTETIILEKAKGGLKVYSNPPEAEIFIDGRSYGVTPKIVKQLPVGEHQLILKMEKYEPYIQTVQVNFNHFNKISGNLKKLDKGDPSIADHKITNKNGGIHPFFKSLFVPGLGQIINGHKRGYFYLAAALGTAGWYYSAYAEHSENMDEYNSAKDIFKINQTVNNALAVNVTVKKTDESYKKGMTALYVLGGVYIINLFDAMLFSSKPETKTYSVKPFINRAKVQNNEPMQLGLTINW